MGWHVLTVKTAVSETLFGESSVAFQYQPVDVQILQPTRWSFVHQYVSVMAKISSIRPIQRVTGSAGENTTGLIYNSAQGAWVGEISLKGLPYGTASWSVQAMDDQGHVGESRGSVYRLLGPETTLALPYWRTDIGQETTLHLGASCNAGYDCVEMRVIVSIWYVGQQTVVADSAGPSLDADIPLASYAGQRIYLDIEAKDSQGESSSQSLSMVVPIDGLHSVGFVKGMILDVDANSILYANDTHLFLKDRKSGEDSLLFTFPNGFPFNYESDFRLTSQGVYLWDGIYAPDGHLYHYQNGVLSVIEYFPEVAGDYIAWVAPDSTQSKHLENVKTGETVDFPPSWDCGWLSLADNGDLACEGSSQTFGKFGSSFTMAVWFYHNGEMEQVYSGNAQTQGLEVIQPFNYVKTDGINLLYTALGTPNYYPSSTHLVLRTPQGEETLAEGLTITVPGSPNDVGLEGGWVAYAGYDGQRNKQLWVRSPQGQKAQQTHETVPPQLKGLSPTGEIVYVRHLPILGKDATDDEATIKGFYSDGHDIGGSLGRYLYRSGEWVGIWNDTVYGFASLYRIDSPVAPPPVRGDAYRDGKVNVTDVVELLKEIIGLSPFLDPQPTVANDLNCDGKVTIQDAVLVLRLVIVLSVPDCSPSS